MKLLEFPFRIDVSKAKLYENKFLELFYFFLILYLIQHHTANIYSQITVGFATQPKSVLSTVKLQPMAVKTTVIDLEDYSYSLSDVFGYNMCSKITVGYATQLKAVPSTVKIFAV